MRKYITTFLVMILFLSFAQISYGYEYYSATEKSAISIFSTGDGGFSLCSGVLIKETNEHSYVLTAKHCVDTFEEVYVEDNLVILQYVSSGDDLALFIVDGKINNKEPTSLAKEDAKIGDSVYHIGYPNLELKYESGKVNRITKDWYYAQMNIIPGCSGGGVWNENGELVGIVWGGLSFGMYGDMSITIYEPLQDINKFLNDIGLF